MTSDKYSPKWLLNKLNESKTDTHKLMHIIDYQKEIAKHTKQLILSGVMQWVAVKDELPPIEVDVLVWDEFNIYICNRLDEDGVVWDESTQILDNVTYWMYLPKPPCA